MEAIKISQASYDEIFKVLKWINDAPIEIAEYTVESFLNHCTELIEQQHPQLVGNVSIDCIEDDNLFVNVYDEETHVEVRYQLIGE